MELNEEEKEKRFCEELTDLLLKHGRGIADEPRVYFLEPIDYDRVVRIDSESKLHF